MAATGEPAAVAVTVNPAGARTTASRWLIHTAWRSGKPFQQDPRRDRRQVGLAELGGAGAGDLAAQHLGEQLVAVADAQHRDPQVQHGRVQGVGVLGVHRGRAARQDDAHRAAGGHLGRRHLARHDLREDVGLAHPAGDETGVLRPEVDDQHPVEVTLRAGAGHPMPIPWWRCRAFPSVWRAGATMTSAFWNSLTSA